MADLATSKLDGPGDVFVNAIVTGDLALVEKMLKERQTNGLQKCKFQDSNGAYAYTVAIQEGYVVMIQMLLKYHVPVGDALLRAVDVNFIDAVQEICSYARKHPDLREAILNCRCKNGDFALRFTPIILAAYNNNFEIVETLLQMGTFIEEPNPNKTPDTIEETHEFIDIYKAMCSEAYMSLASVDPIETAFSIHQRLKRLENLMTDSSAEFTELADRVRCYTGDILGQCRTTEEIMAILTYEEKRKHREAPEGTRFLLVKLLRAIDYNQKEFVAHPNCQQVLKTHFYRGLSSYQDWSTLNQILFTALMLIGFPVISLVYLLVPSVKVKRFVRIPFVKFLLHTAADMSFLIVLVVISVSKSITPIVSFMINYAVLFTLGLAWKHCKEIMADGLLKYLSDSRNLIDTVILILYTSAFMAEIAGSHQIETEEPQYHLQKLERSLPIQDMPSGILKMHHAFHEEPTLRYDRFSDTISDTADADFLSQTETTEGVAQSDLEGNNSQDSNSGKRRQAAGHSNLDSSNITSQQKYNKSRDNAAVAATAADKSGSSNHDNNDKDSSLNTKFQNFVAMYSGNRLKHLVDDVNDDEMDAKRKWISKPSHDSQVDIDEADSMKQAHVREKRRTRGGASDSADVGVDVTNIVLEDGRVNLYTLDEYDPRVVSRVLFGVVGMCVTIRLLSLAGVSETIGPLQVSLGAMGMDIVKFGITYSFVLLAFAVGLTQIYAPYMHAFYVKCSIETDGSSCVEGSFSTFASSLKTLGWILLGFTSKRDTEIDTDHTIIKFTGLVLYGLYIVVGIVVFLNLLIAMMGETYNSIEENADLEWKFTRSKLWTSFLMQGATVPPPFNLIPSLKAFKRILFDLCCPKLAEKEYAARCEERAQMAREIADEKHYKRVLKTLVARYIQHEETTETNAEGSLSLQDVKALKNDIIAFKYESMQKFQATDDVYQNARSCADLVSTNTVQVDSIATSANKVQQESNSRLEDIRTLKTLASQLSELVKEERALAPAPPPPPPPPEPEGTRQSIVMAMASDFESTGRQQEEDEEDDVFDQNLRSVFAATARDGSTRESLTFGDYAELLKQQTARQKEAARRRTSAPLATVPDEDQ